jgi:hypothetical protein
LPSVKEPPITPAVAAKQTDWHVTAAVDYFADSRRSSNRPGPRETARKKFIEHTRLALQAMGLEAFSAAFKSLLGQCREWHSIWADAEPVINALAEELQTARTNESERNALTRRLLDAAILLLSEPATAGAGETRGSK